MADPHWLFVLPAPPWVAPRANAGAGPTFRVLSNKPSDILVEVATEWRLFADPTGRTPSNFYNTLWDSYQKPAIPPASQPAARQKLRRLLIGHSVTARSQTITAVSIPNSAWKRLVQAMRRARSGRLYYRAFAVVGAAVNWFISGRPAAIVSTPDAKAAQAPYIEVTGVGDRLADARFVSRSRPSRATKLSVRNDRIVPAGGSASPSPRVLRGINLSGLQHRRPGYYVPERSTRGRPPRRAPDSRRAADIVPRRLREIRRWDADMIRLPVNQDWVLNGNDRRRPLRYLYDIDRIVRDAAAQGLYVLICNQIVRRIRLPNNKEIGYIAPLPDHQATLFWRILARRYRREPAVMFDLSNEPHRPMIRHAGTPRQFNELDYYTGPLPQDDATWVALWHDWVRALHGVIRSARSDSLIFVSGMKARRADRVSWAADLSSMPVNRRRSRGPGQGAQGLAGVVYSSHMYPAAQAQSKADWDRLLGRTSSRLAGQCPIFIGEWGPDEGDSALVNTGRWINRFANYVRGLHGGTATLAPGQRTPYQGLAGWAAWGWGDRPHLVRRVVDPRTGYQVYDSDRLGNRVPTNWGTKVRSLLGESLRFVP